MPRRLAPLLFGLLAGLAACAGPGREVTDPNQLARLRAACAPGSNQVGDAGHALEDPGRFRILLPGPGCLGRPSPHAWEMAYLLAVTETGEAPGGRPWRGFFPAHVGQAIIWDLRVVYGLVPPRDIGEARRFLEEDLPRLPGGGLEAFFPRISRGIPATFHPGNAWFRVTSRTIGEASPGARCLPFSVASEEYSPGTGVMAAMVGVRIPDVVYRQHLDGRICFGPSGNGVLLAFSHRSVAGDAQAEARAAPLRARVLAAFDTLELAPR
jgi:hypothetical protein